MKTLFIAFICLLLFSCGVVNQDSWLLTTRTEHQFDDMKLEVSSISSSGFNLELPFAEDSYLMSIANPDGDNGFRLYCSEKNENENFILLKEMNNESAWPFAISIVFKTNSHNIQYYRVSCIRFKTREETKWSLPCPAVIFDPWEPDNTSGSGNALISGGNMEFHTLAGTSDDMDYFTAAFSSGVVYNFTIDQKCFGGNLYFDIYNSDGNHLLTRNITSSLSSFSYSSLSNQSVYVRLGSSTGACSYGIKMFE